MGKNQYLSQIGADLVKRFKTRDPFAIAEALGIEVIFCDGFGPLKGMYRVVKRNRFIFINKDLDERMQRIVCAHELGHDQLHRHLARGGVLHEFTLYDMKNKPMLWRRISFWMMKRFWSISTITIIPLRRSHKSLEPTSIWLH